MHDLQHSYLFVRAGTLRCALPLSVVREVMRPLPLRTAAELPAAVLGGTVVRGAVTPVVSLPILLGQPGGGESRFVSVRTESRDCVLAVDAVEQIGELQAEAFQPLPPLLEDIQAAKEIAAADRDFVMTLDLALVSNIIPLAGEATG